MLPNFLIIGAAKCGTTSLYHQLKQHPDIFMPTDPGLKEPTFFSERAEGQWWRGLSWYESLFCEWRGEKAIGEASTSYSKAPYYGDAAEKIHRVIPDARLIYIVRDPIAQIVSHYRHLVYFHDLRRPLDTVIRENDFLLDVACYARQLESYLEHFPREQILVLLFETYTADPIATGRAVCEFLNVDSNPALALEQPSNDSAGRRIERWGQRNKKLLDRLPSPIMRPLERVLTRPLPRPWMSRESYARVMDALAPDLEELKILLGRDLHEWSLEPPGSRD